MTRRSLLLATTVSTFCAMQAHAAGPNFSSDVYVDGSLCVGSDCVFGQGFGFDTVILKENNLRVFFDDTSASGSFPANDWGLHANDTSNGGDNYFAVVDRTANRQVFRVDAGARANALYVDSQGDLGLGTSIPAVDIDVKTGNTPTLRLQQDTSSGFAAQTWDLAGNETSFFIRDATSGSTLPFRIIAGGAPSNALIIDATGDVGIGAGTDPQAPLEIERSDSYVFMRMTATTASPNQSVDVTYTDGGDSGELRYNIVDGDGPEMSLDHNGALELTSSESFNNLRLTATGASPNSSADVTFTDAGADGELRYNIVDGDGPEMRLDAAGNLTITGSLSQGSSRARKTAITPVDHADILQKVTALPVANWSWKDAEEVRHIGPFAEDFHRIFSTGDSAHTIATLDASGVALAAIQALAHRTETLQDRTTRLEAENAELRSRLEALAD
ncbi:MAG: hypothetical protein RIA08_00760 [Roseovarius sp.]|uniref:tail fiber domain-containing protein n=1 Tax=Roseovarius sp. TaxID=1486281 RepID=UPI0032EFA674